MEPQRDAKKDVEFAGRLRMYGLKRLKTKK